MSSLSYHEMIENALFALAERKGSTRQGIWKYISTHYPAADYKQYLIRFKKIDDDKNIVKTDNKQRLKITRAFRESVIKKLAKGEAGTKTKKTKATTKAASKRKSAAKKGGAKAKKPSKAKSTKKTGKAANKKASTGKASGAKKGGAKTKLATGKKTQGSKKVQQ